MEQLFTCLYDQHSPVMNKSIKGRKDMGTLSICWSKFKIQRKDVKLYKHGHGVSGTTCTGSYKLLLNPDIKLNITFFQQSTQPLANPQPNNRVHNHMQASPKTTIVSAHLPTMMAWAHHIYNIQNGERWWTGSQKPHGCSVQQHFVASSPKSQQTPPTSSVGLVCFHLLQIFSTSHWKEEVIEM